ncbi:MAG: AI-2E family transporter [Prevotellaceae bacterium]|jgi:predicted PurR-regulated permease PerM|nr:AI-2E family transporter [Prevotellaceae bacterium]
MSNNERDQYWKLSLLSIIVVMGVILFREITPFLGGLLGALTIYILVRRQMNYLADRRGWRRSLAAVAITSEAILCFLVPLGLVVWLLVNTITNINLDPQAIIAPIEQTVNLLEKKTGYDVMSTDTVSFLISLLPKIGQFLMNSISSLSINLFVLVIVLYFLLMGGRKMERYIGEILPFNAINTREVLFEIYHIVQSNAIGIPLLAVIQGLIATIGYWIFDAPNLLLAGVLTCFATIIPMVGTALVWVPIAIYKMVMGSWFDAIGLLLYGGLVVAQLDNLIRFILQKKMADTHPLITIFGVVIGLSLFGFMGVIFGPLLLALFLLFVDMFKREYLDGRK